MNLLPAQVIGAGQLQLGSKKFSVSGPLADAMASRTGEPLTAGLRPEHLRLAPATNRNLSAEVSHCEALGNEQLVTCKLLDGGHLVQARVGPEERMTPGSTIHLDIDPSGWRLFDSEGEALALPPTPNPEPMLPFSN
jgi:multiple sugar transport system ATP-binding protein